MVVSYNTSTLLDECLESISRETTASGLRADVRVVDNASADGSPQMVAERHPAVRLTALEQNLGYAGGINTALRAWLDEDDAPPPAILVLNADVELLPGSVARLLAALELPNDTGSAQMRTAPSAPPVTNSPLTAAPNSSGGSHSGGDGSTAVVGPALVYPNGTFQHAAFRDPGLVQTLLDLFPVPRLTNTRLNGRYARSLYAAGEPFPVDFPLGACLMVSLPAVRSVGLLDEGYFMYCEEIDWCRRFRTAGYAVLCTPDARVVHHAGASTSQFRSEMRAALWRSRVRLFRLHEPRWRRALLSAIVRLGLGARRAAERLHR